MQISLRSISKVDFDFIYDVTKIEFYQHLGYAIDDVVSLGKRLEQDD
ncbi:MAG: hypothetical protein PUP92_22960 [Rhizonema sp. PD38]|nr:hypothetical protein [Rhizonema sp. PD38]